MFLNKYILLFLTVPLLACSSRKMLGAGEPDMVIGVDKKTLICIMPRTPRDLDISAIEVSKLDFVYLKDKEVKRFDLKRNKFISRRAITEAELLDYDRMISFMNRQVERMLFLPENPELQLPVN